MSERPNPIGGTIAESLFGQGIGAPAVAIDAAQIKQYRDSPAVTDIMEFPGPRPLVDDRFRVARDRRRRTDMDQQAVSLKHLSRQPCSPKGSSK